MTESSKGYSDLLGKMSDWVKKSVEQDVLDLMELKDEASAYLKAAKELTEDEIQLLEQSLSRDLQTFAHHWQQDADASPWWQATKDRLWSLLADASDKGQLALTESFRDIRHHGIYRTGEPVALGELECTQCGRRHKVYHVEVIKPCLQCGNKSFSRVL
ncbi:hypothetical protein P2G88_13875 [Aliiglaciecola sp. CAU 1673]|uniref:zinc ribbon-containing protein n=1 Tax=Aliiglaciecola sp. CAU 1673 TaxID=3032595 RepID=UPI0023DB8E6C|nr:hypothetical protein [Aliiglaciecola sp. CAU 1673]MDF2179342.1 hypothetical protein [Aliiglaciecola sp. CAU 1673]